MDAPLLYWKSSVPSALIVTPVKLLGALPLVVLVLTLKLEANCVVPLTSRAKVWPFGTGMLKGEPLVKVPVVGLKTSVSVAKGVSAGVVV